MSYLKVLALFVLVMFMSKQTMGCSNSGQTAGPDNDNQPEYKVKHLISKASVFDPNRDFTYADAEDNCKGGYCGQNAKCTTAGECVCKPGYSSSSYLGPLGAYSVAGCVLDPCVSDPCGDFATCVPGVGTTFDCICESEFLVKDPDDPSSCVLNPCHGISEPNCKANFTTNVCECPSKANGSSDAIDGSYSEWSEWSSCPINCRVKDADLPMRQQRTRACFPPTGDGAPCTFNGPNIEERSCGDALCPVPPEWSEWGPWESCTSSCPEEGQGTQQRHRICLETGLTSESCENTALPGNRVERRSCQVSRDLVSSCQNLDLGKWSEWNQCSIKCIQLDPDRREFPFQTRTRACSGSDCDSFGKYVSEQIRMCEGIPSCSYSPCHVDWWKAAIDGPYYFGCADPDENGKYWCPTPGGVKSNRVADPTMIHVCNQDEINSSPNPFDENQESKENRPISRRRRQSNPRPNQIFTDNKNLKEQIKTCRNVVALGKPIADLDLCKVKLSMYDEKIVKERLHRTEDIGFIKDLIKALGWSPLARDEDFYVSPFVKYEFYQDVQNNLNEIIIHNENCKTGANRETKMYPKRNSTQFGAKCKNLKHGRKIFNDNMDAKIDNVKSLSDKLNQVTKDFAKAEIAAASLSATAGAVAAGAAAAACITGGTSLIAAAGAVATVAAAVATVASLSIFATKEGLTNNYMNEIKNDHKDVEECMSNLMAKVVVAITDSMEQLPPFLDGEDWNKVTENMMDLRELEAKSDVEMAMDFYLKAYATINENDLNIALDDADKLKRLRGNKSEEEEDDNTVDALKNTKDHLQKLSDCREESGKPVSAIDSSDFLACIVASDFLFNTLNSVGVSVDELKVAKAYGFESYKSAKALRFKQAAEALDLYVDLFTQNIPGDAVKAGSRLKRIRKWQETLSIWVDLPIFVTLSEFKKNIKEAIVKAGVKTWTTFKEHYRAKQIQKIKMNRLQGASTRFGKLNRFKRATKSVGRGLRAAGRGAKNLVKGVGTKVASKLGSKVGAAAFKKFASKVSFGLLDIGFGIWDIIQGVNTLTEGNEQANKFKEAAHNMSKNLDDVDDGLSQFVKIAKCDEEKVSPCAMTKWSSWTPCQHFRRLKLEDQTQIEREGGLFIQSRTRRPKDSFFDQKATGFDLVQCENLNTNQQRLCNKEEKETKGPSIISGSGWMKVYMTTFTTSKVYGYYKKNGTYEGRVKFTQAIDKNIFEKMIGEDRLESIWKKYFPDSQGFDISYYDRKWNIGKKNTEYSLRYFSSEETDATCPDDPSIKWKTNKDGKLQVADLIVICETNSCCK